MASHAHRFGIAVNVNKTILHDYLVCRVIVNNCNYNLINILPFYITSSLFEI